MLTDLSGDNVEGGVRLPRIPHLETVKRKESGIQKTELTKGHKMRPLATFVIFLFSGNLKITQTSGETRSKRGGKVLTVKCIFL